MSHSPFPKVVIHRDLPNDSTELFGTSWMYITCIDLTFDRKIVTYIILICYNKNIKILLDTNIIVYREANKVYNTAIGDLFYW